MAISNKNGYATLYMSGGIHPNNKDSIMTDWDLSSSILKPTGHLKVAKWCVFDKKCVVKTITLDHWMEMNIPNCKYVDFIWADVQGAEHLLIKGGRHTLKKTRFFFTEFCNSPLYENQVPINQLMNMLTEFEPIAIYEGYNILLKNKNF